MFILWLYWSIAGCCVVVPISWTLATLATTPGPQPPSVGFAPRPDPLVLAPPLTTEVSSRPSVASPEPVRTHPAPAPRIELATPPSTTEAPSGTRTCAEIGRLDIPRGDPDYRDDLDTDHDDFGCDDPNRGRTTEPAPTTDPPETTKPPVTTDPPPLIDVQVG